MATLAQLYEDNLHPGAKRLWGLAKDAGLQVSFPAVEKWLKSQERHQEYKQNAMDKPKNWFKITDVPNSFAVDSILKGDFNKDKFGNEGFRGFLLFIELTTRKVYAYPFKSGSQNSPPEASEARDIFERFDNARKAEEHPVARISGDNGKEFDNALVQDFLHNHFITTYFHRPEDHRANGTLNIAARILNRSIGRTDWLKKLPTAVKLWNSHVLRTIKDSPNTLENDVVKRQQVRADAQKHNHEVWARTNLTKSDAHPIVLRYLRRNTEDKGLFEKEGKNFVGDFKVLGRKGWSHQLDTGRAYRPYELQKSHKTELDTSDSAYRVQEKEKEANRKEAMTERKLAQDLGKTRSEPVDREMRKRAPPPAKALPPPAEPKRKVAKVDKTTIPKKLLDWDFGETRKNADSLRFKVEWEPTREFKEHWENQKSAFEKWDDDKDLYISWWPYAVAFAEGYSVESQNNFKPSDPRARELVKDLVRRSRLSGEMTEREAVIIQTRYGLI